MEFGLRVPSGRRGSDPSSVYQVIPAPLGLLIDSWKPVVTIPPRLLKFGPLSATPATDGSHPRARNWLITVLVRPGTQLLVIALTALCQVVFVYGTAVLESPQ